MHTKTAVENRSGQMCTPPDNRLESSIQLPTIIPFIKIDLLQSHKDDPWSQQWVTLSVTFKPISLIFSIFMKYVKMKRTGHKKSKCRNAGSGRCIESEISEKTGFFWETWVSREPVDLWSRFSSLTTEEQRFSTRSFHRCVHWRVQIYQGDSEKHPHLGAS